MFIENIIQAVLVKWQNTSLPTMGYEFDSRIPHLFLENLTPSKLKFLRYRKFKKIFCLLNSYEFSQVQFSHTAFILRNFLIHHHNLQI